jgi:PAS domain S-box-containing protein
MSREISTLREVATDGAAEPVDIFDSFELSSEVEFQEFKHFLDHLPIAVMISKLRQGSQRIVYANAVFEALTGHSFSEAKDGEWSLLSNFCHEDDRKLTLDRALLAGDDYVGTFTSESPKHVVVEAYAGIVQDEESEEKYRIAALVDVTERERAQREEFARTIRDKDLLLKEIQHRVKNNLQLITALIRLEARAERGGDKVNLDRLAGRIDSLQFLYQALAAEPPGQDIDLGQYLSQIAAGVMRAHAVDGIRLDVKVEPVPVSINVAMPIGLAVNELLTNAFKYAFAGRDGGVISLECLRDEPDLYRVVVADNGTGLPPGTSWPAEGKLGALIMQTLRENARKTGLSVQSSAGCGTRVSIRFVHSAANRRAA